MHTRRNTSKAPLYVLLVLILGGLLYAVYSVNSAGTVRPIGVMVESSEEKGVVKTHIYAFSSKKMYIRGYYIKLTGGNNSSTIKDIHYTLGTVSEGLGSDNKSLKIS